MGKRSDFKTNDRSFYRTPMSAVLPVIPFVKGARFAALCAGDGQLVDHLTSHGLICEHASDIHPLRHDIIKMNALDYDGPSDRIIVENPPWERVMLHPMIDHFRKIAPTWLLFDSDWMHTIQAAPYLPFCRTIVSVGRVSWMDNGTSGMDNCCWYNFLADECQTIFIGREAKTERCEFTMEMFK